MGVLGRRAVVAKPGEHDLEETMVAFVGIFQLMGVIFIALVPLVLLMKRPKARSGPVASH